MARNSELSANQAVSKFCQRHSLAGSHSLQPDAQVIALMAQGLETFSDALGLATRNNRIAVDESAWALIRAMILRGFAHADAGFVCVATGSGMPASSVAANSEERIVPLASRGCDASGASAT